MQIFKKKSYHLATIVIVLINCNIALAQGKLVIAFSELPPWKIIQNNVFKGVYAEIAREIANESGLEPEFKKCPLKRCLRMIKNGSADLIIGIKKTTERLKYIKFLSTPYRSSSSKVFYIKNNEHRQLLSYSDLYNFEHIGTKNGAKYFEYFDKDIYLNKSTVLSNEQNFAKLLNGRINIFIIDEAQGKFLEDRLKLQGQVKIAPFYYKDNSFRYVGISKHSLSFSKFHLFESAMMNIVNTGRLDKIMDKHFFKPYNILPGEFNWK